MAFLSSLTMGGTESSFCGREEEEEERRRNWKEMGNRGGRRRKLVARDEENLNNLPSGGKYCDCVSKFVLGSYIRGPKKCLPKILGAIRTRPRI